MAIGTTKFVVKQLAERMIRTKKRVISKVESDFKKKHAIKKGKAVLETKKNATKLNKIKVISLIQLK